MTTISGITIPVTDTVSTRSRRRRSKERYILVVSVRFLVSRLPRVRSRNPESDIRRGRGERVSLEKERNWLTFCFRDVYTDLR